MLRIETMASPGRAVRSSPILYDRSMLLSARYGTTSGGHPARMGARASMTTKEVNRILRSSSEDGRSRIEDRKNPRHGEPRRTMIGAAVEGPGSKREDTRIKS